MRLEGPAAMLRYRMAAVVALSAVIYCANSELPTAASNRSVITFFNYTRRVGGWKVGRYKVLGLEGLKVSGQRI